MSLVLLRAQHQRLGGFHRVSSPRENGGHLLRDRQLHARGRAKREDALGGVDAFGHRHVGLH